MRKAAATSRRGGQSKQEIEPPGSVDERPARDPEENAGGSFPATAVLFQIISVIFRIPSRIHLQRSTIGCRRLCVVQQGQCSEKCLECLDRALERNGGTLEEDSSPYGILDRDGSILYGSRELLGRVREIHPHLHLFGHIHKSHGTTSDGVTVFSNAAIMDEGYDNLNAPNVLSLTVLEN